MLLVILATSAFVERSNSAFVERSNSALKYIKNVSMNSMSEPRLNALILMYVHMKLVQYLSLESLYSVFMDKPILLHRRCLKKYLCWSLFSINFKDWWPATLLIRDPNTGVFLLISQLLEKSFFMEHLGWLLLKMVEEILRISKGCLTQNDLYDSTNLNV